MRSPIPFSYSVSTGVDFLAFDFGAIASGSCAQRLSASEIRHTKYRATNNALVAIARSSLSLRLCSCSAIALRIGATCRHIAGLVSGDGIEGMQMGRDGFIVLRKC